MTEKMIPAQMCWDCSAFVEVFYPVTGELIFRCTCEEVVIPYKWRHNDSETKTD